MRTYTTGEFARRANVSIRTIRFYDQKGVLKPTEFTEAGYRLYTDHDFAKLQRIIVLKSLGFTLEEIISISTNDNNSDFVKQSFDLQLKLVKEKMNSLKVIEQSIKEASQIIEEKKEEGWGQIVRLIHLLNMEETIVAQYKNSKNIEVRIDLHKLYSNRSEGWFTWNYQQMNAITKGTVLEIGCGNGELWSENMERIPEEVEIILSDISPGMLRSAQTRLKNNKKLFHYECFDCHKIPYEKDTFDVIIANHVMFYLKDREKVMQEIKRVLKPEGTFYCTTYGESHMKEVEQLTKEFDDRIALSEVKLYDIFGLEQGEMELLEYFEEVKKLVYEDFLLVTSEKPLMEYIMSCHGNQGTYLQGRQDGFAKFLKQKIGKKGVRISKEAGMFCCRKLL